MLARFFHRLHGLWSRLRVNHEPDDIQDIDSVGYKPADVLSNGYVGYKPADSPLKACRRCDGTSFGSESPFNKHVIEIMHKPCLECPPLDNVYQHLCSDCKHWRLRHLFNCLSKSEAPQDKQGRTYGTTLTAEIAGHRISSECDFCRIILHQSGIISEYLSETLSVYNIIIMRISLNERSGRIQLYTGKDDWISPRFINLYTPGDVPDRVGTKIQWSLVNTWLMECTKTHNKCHKQYFERPNTMRLIDVRQRKLVKANDNSKFVALSYVWGTKRNPERLTCTMSNVEELEQNDALKADKLPRTIEDALQVCEYLGESFLWVDRLCIVQDDPSYKHEQIDAMAKIFSSAHLVLVVLDGDMETGIPGIQPRPSKMQIQEEIDGLVYMNELPRPEDLISHSNWATRGWTYQEAILARRKLYFSRVQVFLECNTNFREEDATTCFTRELKQRSSLAENGWSFNEWNWHLWKYTARSLSYQSDVYNAIGGISNALLPQPASWLFGLPRRDFDEALLWFPFNSLEQAYRTSDKVLLPSWSWSSVEGQIMHPGRSHGVGLGLHGIGLELDRNRPVYAGTPVAWQCQEENSTFSRFVPVRNSESVSRKGGHSFIDSKRSCVLFNASGAIGDFQSLYGATLWETSLPLLCFGIAWSQGCIEMNWPFPALTERTFLELGEGLEKLWHEVGTLERDIVFCAPQEEETTTPEMEISLNQSTLRGRAQTSFFHLGIGNPDFLAIVDNEGRSVGRVDRVKGETANARLETSPFCKYELIGLSISYFDSPSDLDVHFHRFLANDPMTGHLWRDARNVSTSLHKAHTQEEINHICEILGPGGLDISYHDSQGSALGFIPIVNVMLAEWDGPVARRISIGWVFLTKWVESNPQFKTVYLA